jgi:hypothetical protein
MRIFPGCTRARYIDDHLLQNAEEVNLTHGSHLPAPKPRETQNHGCVRIVRYST